MTVPGPSTPPPEPAAAAPSPLPADVRNRVGAELDRLLAEQLRRLRLRYLWHGLGKTLLLPATALVLFFALDYTLQLPLVIRLLHTTAIAALFGFGLWQFVRYPLRRPFGPVDIAVLLERNFPQLHQRLVSAVQLKSTDGDALRNQSPAMIDALLQETGAAVQALPLQQLFDNRRTKAVWAAAGTVVLALGSGALLAPTAAWVFVQRHLGLSVSYPRATELVVELPEASPDLQRSDGDGVTDLVLPAGADLHVFVLARGVVPKEVSLEVTTAGGEQRSVLMTPRPGDRFRHVFRRLGSSFEFHARGGDDDRGDRLVRVRTMHPPQVASIKAELRPPAYTGAEVVVSSGGAIEALAGTQVTLAVSTTAPVRSAAMVFLETGRRLELEPLTVQDDSGARTLHGASFTVTASDRYQIELVGDNGLRNPNPGTWPIAMLQDYAPVGRWILPEDESATMLLPGALLCVRVEARDDFGFSAVELAVETVAGRSSSRSLLPPATPGERPPTALIHTELLEVRDLFGGSRPGSDGLSLQLDVRDNRQPEPGVTTLPRRQVQIVDEQQLAAAIGRAFRALREETERAHDLQIDRRSRAEELLARSPRPGNDSAPALTGIEVGQGRIQGTATRLHLGLMRAFDLHLWNRLEPGQNAAKLPEIYQDWHRQHPAPEAHAAGFYRELLQRRAAGTLGAMETTLDPILGMIALADDLGRELCPQLTRLLSQAHVARDSEELRQLLGRTLEVQGRVQQTLKQLLDRLDGWNDFQDLVQETRELRDRQRDLQNRTEGTKGRQ